MDIEVISFDPEEHRRMEELSESLAVVVQDIPTIILYTALTLFDYIKVALTKSGMDCSLILDM